MIRTKEEELVTVKGQPDYHRCLDPDVYDKPTNGLAGIEKVLKQITFAPSCVDMNWGWEVEHVYIYEGPDFKEAGFRLRTTFQRPDRATGELQTGFGRWWEVPADVTVSGVVKTAYAAARMILEHELMESFKWKNSRVFDPHNTVQELAALGGNRYQDTIP